MTFKTAAAVVKYIDKIEAGSAEFYREQASRFPELKSLFNKLAKENQKYGKRIKKVYYSAVTDALETNFSFEGLMASIDIPEVAKLDSPLPVLKAGLALEKQIRLFYVQAAGQSKGLLADITRAMQRMADDREKRIREIESSLQQR